MKKRTTNNIELIAGTMVLLAVLIIMGCERSKPQDVTAEEIHNATFEQNHAKVKSILATNPKLVNAKDNDGWTTLHEAVAYTDKKMVEFLITSGADINAKDNEGHTPLYFVGYGNEQPKEVAELLISHGADVNVKDKHGRSPLILAAIDGDVEVAELLIAHGAKVNDKDNEGNTALHMASYEGHEEVIKLLISKEADINSKNNMGDTPQTLATKGKRDRERNIWIDKQIPVTFTKDGWKFYKGSDNLIGFPIEAFLKLVAVKGDEKRILPSTKNLKGYVQINSCDDALSFVRLFTDLDTHYLFEDSEYIEVRPTANKPSWGELPVQEFTKLGLKEPSVTKDGEYFVVARYVVDADRNIFQIQERISPSGDYQITKMILVAKDADILFPMYI